MLRLKGFGDLRGYHGMIISLEVFEDFIVLFPYIDMHINVRSFTFLQVPVVVGSIPDPFQRIGAR